MKHMRKAVAMMLAALTIASCSDNKFTVEGQIGNAKDSVLYFENVASTPQRLYRSREPIRIWPLTIPSAVPRTAKRSGS